MIVERVYLMDHEIVVVITGMDNCHLAFDLQNIPNVDNLIKKIKDKVADIGTEPHSPPETDWEPFFNELKIALEGLDIGD